MNKIQRKTKQHLVIGICPEQYQIKDYRLNKPVCHQKLENGVIKGSMLLQDLDSVKINNKEISYYCPNNISILLSISSKALDRAEQMFKDSFCNGKVAVESGKAGEDKRNYLDTVSSTVCDYVELIQTSVVFGYTALETFANLSIPAGYTYEINNTSKNIKEIYGKEAIERWIPLKTKLKDILKGIYETKTVVGHPWWECFCCLEKYRHDIIHQKSINSTDFYKVYFDAKIFNVCKAPVQIVKFFYEQHAEANKTNAIWPWLVNENNYFPVNQEYDPVSVEVIGNLHEGKRKGRGFEGEGL